MDYNFSFDELKSKFNLSNNTNVMQLIIYLNNKNFSIAIACDNIDSFLIGIGKHLLFEHKKYSQFKKEILREIKSYNDFLLNVNFDENNLILNMEKGVFAFSKREVIEIKKKVKRIFINKELILKAQDEFKNK